MTTMADKTNGPRFATREPSNAQNLTASKRTLQPPDFSRCDRSCGQCFVTFIGDQRKCEVDFLDQSRRELAEMLAGGGDDA